MNKMKSEDQKIIFPYRIPIFLFFISILIIIAYYQILNHDFLNLDDPLQLTSNPHVLSGFSWVNILWSFSPLKGSLIYFDCLSLCVIYYMILKYCRKWIVIEYEQVLLFLITNWHQNWHQKRSTSNRIMPEILKLPGFSALNFISW